MEEKATTPRSLGIIMDGNRRWAKARGLSTFEGHQRGYARAKDAARWCRDAGVKYMILYAFSNENWSRGADEVGYLRTLFEKMIFEDAEELRQENGAIRFIGDIEKFGKKFAAQAKYLEDTNPKDPSATVVIALSYGGRAEILRAANALIKENPSREVDEAAFGKHLYTAGIPDPDLIIRTSGEQRLSGFLPWQSTYSELFFVEKHWPDFEKADFDAVLEEYAARERRHGK